jgi:4-carboxymuconolactone decarboxylase
MKNEGVNAASHAPRRVRAREIARDVIGVEVTDPRLPYTEMGLDFVYGEVWSSPGLTRKERRWITLACVGAGDGIPTPDQTAGNGRQRRGLDSR